MTSRGPRQRTNKLQAAYHRDDDAHDLQSATEIIDAAQRRLERTRQRDREQRAAERRSRPGSPKRARPRQEQPERPDAFAAPIPEGLYHVAFVSEERGSAFGRGVLFVRFRIIDGPHTGRELIRFYNVPRGGYLARSSGLYRDFLAVLGRRPPSDGFPPSWAFGECVLAARVVTVADRPGPGGKRVPMDESERYSKIDALVSLVSGSSPALRGSGRAAAGKPS